MMKIGRYLSIVMCFASSSASALSVALSDGDGAPVSSAVVAIIPENADGAKSPTLMDRVSVQQKDRAFAPKVSVIPLNQQVYFPNNDDVLHHVYSFSPAKTFEFALYGNNESPGITFDKTGLIVLGCNIHDQMRGYIYVTDAPYYGVSDKDGKLDISLSNTQPYPQKYTLEIWHPEQKSQQPKTEILVIENAEQLDKVLQFSLNLRPRREESFDRFEQGDYE